MRIGRLAAALTMLAAATLPAQRGDSGVRVLALHAEARVRTPGDVATSELVVAASAARRAWLGYSVRDPRGHWFDVPSRAVELSATETILRHDWRVPTDPPPLSGSYAVVMSLWDARPEDGSPTRLASARREDAFRVHDGLVPLAAVAGTSWRAATHRLGRGRLRAEEVYAHGADFRLRLAAGGCDGAELRTVARHGYGDYTARLRTPRAPGSLSALFLYADVSGGNDEIDIEIFNDGSGDVLLTTWVAGVKMRERRVALGFDPSADFHEYGISWRASELRFLADGVELAIWRDGYPTRPMRLMANAWWPSWLECTPLHEPADLVIQRIHVLEQAR